MKKAARSILLAAVLASIPAAAPAAESGAKAAIDSLNQEFVAAWNVHDAKKMASFWAENGDLINPFGRKGSGRAGVEKIFEAEHGGEMKASTYKIESMSVRELTADVALGDWECVVTGMVDPAGQPLPPFTHHAAVVYVKQGGRWWIAAGRPYAFVPPPAPASK
jgi:uncharacterized protein (TIGR02246 family)